MGGADPTPPRSVALVTLGCARNEVDSEELAGRLAASGWRLVDDPAAADVAVVNTCGFVEQAKKDSIDALLEASDLKHGGRTRAVVAVGCLAERYGAQLAEELPEADAVLGFDSYADLARHLDDVLAGVRPAPHVPADRRRLLPLAPVERPTALDPQMARGPRVRLDDRPWAPLKIASGCDRRCSFCAIPGFRGSFVSRTPDEILAEAQWLSGEGVRELFLVSENSTSYGKDLGDLRLLEKLLPQVAAVEGIDRVRVSYMQPAEVRPALVDAMAGTRGVAPYFDLSFQHASADVLRRMRRFGSGEAFLELVESIRRRAPQAGIRSNVIVGFPGETEADVGELESFLEAARLDVCGVFAYSDEDGTEAASYDDKIHADEVADRYERVRALVEELTAQRAEERVGERVVVLVEEVDDGRPVGRAAHQGPEVDGVCVLTGELGDEPASLRSADGAAPAEVGSWVVGTVVGSDGADLYVEAR